MKILITNHHLLDFTGSETFTYTIAKYLKKNNHHVIVYSKYVDEMLPLFKENNINVVESLEEIKKEKFDLAHVHHMINAFEVRYYFPKLPLIYLSHGVIPILEQTPFLDLNISKFLAVSEEVKKNLVKQGVPKNKITIFRNIVDQKLFFPKNPISQFPKKALVISAKIDQRKEEIIREACQKLNIQIKFIGGRFGVINYKEIPKYINEVDLVISLGRGIIEAIFCGRIPFVFDYLGGDGIVSSENIKKIMRFNFSGRAYKKEYKAEDIINEIKKCNREDVDKLRNIASNYFDAEININKLIKIYKKISKVKVSRLSNEIFKKVKTFVMLINETRLYDYINLTRKFEAQNNELRYQLQKIQSSKTYKVWQGYCRLRDRIFKRKSAQKDIKN